MWLNVSMLKDKIREKLANRYPFSNQITYIIELQPKVKNLHNINTKTISITK